MIPIHELLNRVRWDPEFARGSFQLGYYDRAEDRIILVPFEDVNFPQESPQAFQLTMRRGEPTASRFTACGRFTKTPNVFGTDLNWTPPKLHGTIFEYACEADSKGLLLRSAPTDRRLTSSRLRA